MEEAQKDTTPSITNAEKARKLTADFRPLLRIKYAIGDVVGRRAGPGS